MPGEHEHHEDHWEHEPDERKGIVMPLWILAPLLGYAVTVGSAAVGLAVKDHYHLEAYCDKLTQINEDGSRKLRQYLTEEGSRNQQMIYLQGSVAEVRNDVKAMREQNNQTAQDIYELKIMIQSALGGSTRDDHQ